MTVDRDPTGAGDMTGTGDMTGAGDMTGEYGPGAALHHLLGRVGKARGMDIAPPVRGADRAGPGWGSDRG
jgi:hypothetical protein